VGRGRRGIRAKVSTTSGARQLIEVLEILGRSLERRNAGELRVIRGQGKPRGG
jgi:hypothetical protein